MNDAKRGVEQNRTIKPRGGWVLGGGGGVMVGLGTWPMHGLSADGLLATSCQRNEAGGVFFTQTSPLS